MTTGCLLETLRNPPARALCVKPGASGNALPGDLLAVSTIL